MTTEPAPVAPRDTSGSVTLVGAGPGDPDLITVAGLRALEAADVVFADRLGPGEALRSAAPRARWVDVGKLPGWHKVPQEEINRLLVQTALAGNRVVRLKGGDPFVFGRGQEEAAACRAAGVPVRVIPGVTSAIAVPGAAGIPVTSRGLSRSVSIVTGHEEFSDEFSAAAAAIVQDGGTLVVLMGMLRLAGHLAALTGAGLDPATPAAVVQEGLTPQQRSIVATVGTLAQVAAQTGLGNPAVIVVGQVAALSASAT
ncbi:hypothetical protein GCM10010401_13410 [Rarobacter faecitabidus]|uniref:uroporphyrinogen-III C-methyltransferase n=1 Tax=Rarobacter faecitabidus TaxID=13243 RepID=A0A542ZE86_RARFA|nr:uroporphyrinogen-III C-methyltransferase [Rarobacter faecitabidus]TQL58611.1 uroporphyrin-III C-methyltransferase [Rarobacter faecitabidus]